MKMELIEGSETSAISIVTPGNYPKENILHTIIFLASVLSSVRPHGTTPLLLEGLTFNLIFADFFKNMSKNKASLKSEKNNGCFT